MPSDSEINGLPAAAPLDGSELIAADQGVNTVKIGLSAILAWITAALSAAMRLIPAGGSTGQYLRKTTIDDYEVEWSSAGLVPDSSNTGYVLKQRSGTAGDYGFEPPASGAPGAIQYNDGSSLLAGSLSTKIVDGDLALTTLGSITSPPIGEVKIFGCAVASRVMPAFVGGMGIDSVMQPFWGRNKIGYWAPLGNSSAAPLADGIAAPTLYGTAGARNVAATNILTSMRRLANASATTAGAAGGWRHPTVQFFRSTNPQGGFFFVCRFGEDNTLADSRCFVGFWTNTTAIGNVNPSTLTNIIGVGFDSGETTWRVLHNDGSGTATKIDLGADFPCNTSDQAYEVAIFAPPGQSKVWVQMTRLGTAFSTTVEISSSDLPALNTMLTFHLWCNNGTTAAAKTLCFTSVYIETDY